MMNKHVDFCPATRLTDWVEKVFKKVCAGVGFMTLTFADFLPSAYYRGIAFALVLEE